MINIQKALQKYHVVNFRDYKPTPGDEVLFIYGHKGNVGVINMVKFSINTGGEFSAMGYDHIDDDKPEINRFNIQEILKSLRDPSERLNWQLGEELPKVIEKFEKIYGKIDENDFTSLFKAFIYASYSELKNNYQDRDVVLTFFRNWEEYALSFEEPTSITQRLKKLNPFK
jgi:hypothetical protein